MWAVSPGRAAVQDMDTDHGRLYVAMAEKFLDRADIVAPSSGCVADKWPLWVICGHAAAVRVWSASITKADLIAAGLAAGVRKGTVFRIAERHG